jgi:hypothetical protein
MNYFSVGYSPEVDTAKGREWKNTSKWRSLYLASFGMTIELQFFLNLAISLKDSLWEPYIYLHTYLHEYTQHMCCDKCVCVSQRNKEQLQYYGPDRSTISTETFQATGSLLHSSRPNANLLCIELAICNSRTSHDKGDNLLTETP